MAKLYYSMSGEGRGHAARVRAMVEHLRANHDLTLFAPGDAFSFLSPLYAGTPVKVEPLPGMLFEYNGQSKLNYSRTVKSALTYFRRFPILKKSLQHRMRQDAPDLVITDFEPALPRAARSLGIPFVSLNHQHFLLTYDLSSLPLWLRLHTFYIKRIVQAYYSGQAETIVSSFYFPPLKRGCTQVTQVGVLLRPEFGALQTSDEGHLLVYCRRFAVEGMLNALNSAGLPVRVYGLGEQPSRGRLEFRAVDEARFMEDLASCKALITTAGNQLVGEALYLRKPVLALPESGNYEQFINAHFLRQSRCGDWVELERIDSQVISSFLTRLESFQQHMDPSRMNGVPKALAVLRRCLPPSRPNLPAGKRTPAHA